MNSTFAPRPIPRPRRLMSTINTCQTPKPAISTRNSCGQRLPGSNRNLAISRNSAVVALKPSTITLFAANSFESRTPKAAAPIPLTVKTTCATSSQRMNFLVRSPAI